MRAALVQQNNRSGDAPANAEADLDFDLVERFLAGDRSSFDQIVRRYQRPIYYLCLRYARNDADAADLVQKTFVRCFNGLHRFQRRSSVKTWIFRIAINLSLNAIRDRRRERPTEIADDALTADAVGPSRIIAQQQATLVREHIARLPPKQRLVLELRIYDELSFREVAEIARCTENAAKVNFHHAVKRLRGLVVQSQQEGES